ncbi:S8 family serine peptidase [Sphingomonas sp. RT2P30]|uniref:S8 family serine peptidase n=1 Tax=Parasphingomonas halimpatiens TaxID=3096162 RepID=UPI002FC869D2
MDPALQELIAEGEPDDEVAVVVRLHHGARAPAALRIVAEFGVVATARARRGLLRALHADPAIASLKAPRDYARELETIHGAGEADGPPDAAPDDVRRPPGLSETGRGTAVCVIDWSLDYAHPDFRNADGSTRLLGLWDQRGPAAPANRYGYGRIHAPATIDRALGQPDPFTALGYTPAANAHGTHVLGIAAGNGRAGGPQGIAPEAGLIFVHLGNGGGDLGNSIELLEGIDFAVRTAGERPLVINLSLGRHAGPHDGTLLVERAIDWLLINRPGTAVVQSAGNYYSRDVHMAGRISETRAALLPFRMTQRDAVPVSVEIWYNGADEFTARMRGPGGASAAAALGRNAPVRHADGREIGFLYHRIADPNNGDNLINLILRREAAAGVWEIEIEGVDVVDGRWHAWIERNAACRPCQAQFRHDLAEPQSTTGSICNALRTIAVGAYDAHDPAHPLPDFSSVGPTRDGRRKPLLAAPGVRVLSVRSRSDPSAAPGYLRMSGTSMAAPHVTGTLALMLQAAGLQRVTALRRTLFATLANAGTDEPRWGYGQLNIVEAVTRARTLPAPPATPAAPPRLIPPASHASEGGTMPPDLIDTATRLARDGVSPTDFPHALVGEPAAALLRRALDPADRSVGVVAWHGQRLVDDLRAGDMLLRHGPTRTARMAVIADPVPLGGGAMRRRGVVTEGAMPGRYVSVIEPGGGTMGFARRITGPDGLMLPDTVVLRHAGEGGDEAVPPPSGPHPMIRRGSSGPAVAEAQTKLNRVHASRNALDRCPLTVDGIFGPNTSAATVSFQRFAFPGQPSEWDGVIGPKTWAMLDAYGADDTPPVMPHVLPWVDRGPPGIVPIVFPLGLTWRTDNRGGVEPVPSFNAFGARSASLDSSGPSSEPIDFDDFEVPDLRTFLLDAGLDVTPRWFGVAVSNGLDRFDNFNVFFHPQPDAKDVAERNDTYERFGGSWRKVFGYVRALGRQLVGSGKKQILVVPFVPPSDYTAKNSFLHQRWQEILSSIGDHVQTTLLAEREVAGPQQASRVANLILSSFSIGIAPLDNFRSLAAGSASVTREIWDFDGHYAQQFKHISLRLRNQSIPLVQFDQVPAPTRRQAIRVHRIYHVPGASWSNFPAHKTATKKPVIDPHGDAFTTSQEVHRQMTDTMALHAFRTSSVG